MSIIKYNWNLKVNVIKSVYLVTRPQHSKSSLLFSINTIRQTNKNHQTINPLVSTPSRLQLQHLQNYYWSNSHKRRPSITKGVFHKGKRRGEEGRREERGGGEERGVLFGPELKSPQGKGLVTAVMNELNCSRHGHGLCVSFLNMHW